MVLFLTSCLEPPSFRLAIKRTNNSYGQERERKVVSRTLSLIFRIVLAAKTNCVTVPSITQPFSPFSR